MALRESYFAEFDDKICLCIENIVDGSIVVIETVPTNNIENEDDCLAAADLPDLSINYNSQRTVKYSDKWMFKYVFVANRHFFLERHLLFRTGMKGIYSISMEFILGSSVCTPVLVTQFMPSSAHGELLGAVDFDNLFGGVMQDKMFELFIFRCNLAEMVTKLLLHSKGRGGIVSGDVTLSSIYAFRQFEETEGVIPLAIKHNSRVVKLLRDYTFGDDNLLCPSFYYEVPDAMSLCHFLGSRYCCAPLGNHNFKGSVRSSQFVTVPSLDDDRKIYTSGTIYVF